MQKRLGLVDLLLIAEALLGEPAERLLRKVSIVRAEAALAAPAASFDGVEFYPDPVERAAVCCSRLVRNHPFPRGNKEIAYECMREMLEREGISWPHSPQDDAEVADLIEALAMGRLREEEFVSWVRSRVG